MTTPAIETVPTCDRDGNWRYEPREAWKPVTDPATLALMLCLMAALAGAPDAMWQAKGGA